MLPRHRWQPTGLVTTGRYGAVIVWQRCEWCGQVDTSQRRRRLEPCCGAPRPPELPRPRRWWLVVAKGVPLPPEPEGGFPPLRAPCSHDPIAPLPCEPSAANGRLRGREGGAAPAAARLPRVGAHPEVAIDGSRRK